MTIEGRVVHDNTETIDAARVEAARAELRGNGLSREELKAVLNKSDRTIDRLIRDGMPRRRYAGYEIFNISEIKAFFDNRAIGKRGAPRGRGRPRIYPRSR